VKAPRVVAGLVAILLRVLVQLGCAHIPTTSPGPDASAAAVATCANLARLGCAVGADPACAGRLELAVSEHHASEATISCGRTASSRTALAACGPFFGCGP
jgi:hypothetical protein